MDINDLTIGQAKQLAEMLAGQSPAPIASPHIGKKCIIRTYASGVHFGTLVSLSGRHAELVNARRLWRFDVTPHGISLSEVSLYGSPGDLTRICEEVPQISLLDALEVIPCSVEAVASIENAETYKP